MTATEAAAVDTTAHRLVVPGRLPAVIVHETETDVIAPEIAETGTLEAIATTTIEAPTAIETVAETATPMGAFVRQTAETDPAIDNQSAIEVIGTMTEVVTTATVTTTVATMIVTTMIETGGGDLFRIARDQAHVLQPHPDLRMGAIA